MILRAPLTMTDWIHSKAETFLGLAMKEKCYLPEFLHDQEMVAKGSVTFRTEEIAQLTIIQTSPLPKPLTTPQKEALIELWGPTEWSHIWPMHCLLVFLQLLMKPKLMESGKGVEWPMLRKEPERSAQTNNYRQTRQTTTKSKRKISIFSSTWCMCNRIVLWPSKWYTTGRKMAKISGHGGHEWK